MVTVLKRILHLACPPILAMPVEDAVPQFRSAPADDPAVAAARANLRAAIAQVKAAEAVLQEAQAGTARAHRAIADSKAADREAEAAEAECVAAATAHSTSGSTGEVAPELFARAEQARAKAHRLSLIAKGARAALCGQVAHDYGPELGWKYRTEPILQAEVEAGYALETAKRLHAAAVANVIQAVAAPMQRRADQLMRELIPLYDSLVGLQRLGKFNVPFRDGAAARVPQLPNYTPNTLDSFAHPWIHFGDRLMKDPDAPDERMSDSAPSRPSQVNAS